jgi:subtilisin family serine protease
MPAKSYSLHIGLNAVDPIHYQGWDGQLLCCENDANFYYELAKKASFTISNVLLTQAANSESLVHHLSGAAKDLKEDDLFFLTYSGHGGSILDLNFDEDDLQDETWCLYDRQFLDDELFAQLALFKTGVKVFVISDSCHSGTVTKVVPDPKELALRKDIADIYAKYQLRVKNAPADVLEKTFRANRQTYKAVAEKAAVDTNDIGCSVTLFAACQDNQKAAEWESYGLFTTMIKRVLENDREFESYQDLFEKVKNEVPPFQVPNLFVYGNADFDFINDPPFLQATEHLIKEKEPEATDIEADGLLIGLGNNALSDTLRSSGEMVGGVKEGKDYFLIRNRSADKKVWDDAYHQYFRLAATGKNNDKVFVEPNIRSLHLREQQTLRSASGNEYMSTWPRPTENYENEFIWHLDDTHSQLRKAYLHIINTNPKAFVRIGHIDTGYRPGHPSTPKFLMKELGVSFVNKDQENKGIDIPKATKIAEQDGHGCATLALLAGNKISISDSYANFEGEVGAIPFAEVVPIRICDTVFNFFNANDVADGIDYAVENGCEVITMSMAGYPTKTVARAVNRAYEKGVVIVTASGNNWFKGIKKITPNAVMYPARFERVVAATGVCFNDDPYDNEANPLMRVRSEGGGTMQGNWGPQKAMTKAIAGYTPNLPWATEKEEHRFLKSGGGTSSATPQVAATFALWIAHNRETLKSSGLAGTWKQVEAARSAIFKSAGKAYPAYKKYYGNGIIKAFDALDAFDFNKDIDGLKISEEAKVNFFGLGGFVGQWFKAMPGDEANTNKISDDETLKEMISLEIVQALYKDPALFKYTEALEFDNDEYEFLANDEARAKFFQQLKQSPLVSDFLKSVL